MMHDDSDPSSIAMILILSLRGLLCFFVINFWCCLKRFIVRKDKTIYKQTTDQIGLFLLVPIQPHSS